MELIAIYFTDTDSWSGVSTFRAVAVDEKAAKKWVQDEVDGKHPDSHRTYMQGKDADWWIQYGSFTLTPISLHADIN